jgi:hypothetical protein
LIVAQLLEGCHQAIVLMKSQRSTLFPQEADGRTDRILSCCPSGHIRVGSMKGKVRLVQFAKQVPVFPHELPACLHVGFCLLDPAFRQ